MSGRSRCLCVCAPKCGKTQLARILMCLLVRWDANAGRKCKWLGCIAGRVSRGCERGQQRSITAASLLRFALKSTQYRFSSFACSADRVGLYLTTCCCPALSLRLWWLRSWEAGRLQWMIAQWVKHHIHRWSLSLLLYLLVYWFIWISFSSLTLPRVHIKILKHTIIHKIS